MIADEGTGSSIVGGGSSSNSNSNSSPNNDDIERLQDELRLIGLENYPIDTSSLNVLKQLLVVNNSSSTCTSKETKLKQNQQYYLEKYNEYDDDDDIIMDYNDSTKVQTNNQEDKENYTSTTETNTKDVNNNNTNSNNNNNNNNTKFEQNIIRLMEQQTKMLLLLHDRMETLNQTIDDHWISQQIQNNNYNYNNNNNNQKQHEIHYVPVVVHGQQGHNQQQNNTKGSYFGRMLFPSATPPPVPVPVPPDTDPRQVQQNQIPQIPVVRVVAPPVVGQQQPVPVPVVVGGAAIRPPHPRHSLLMSIWNSIQSFIVTIDEIIQYQKIILTIKIFISLYTNHVRPFDFNVLIKIVFMIAILLSRIERRNSNSNSGDDDESSSSTFHYTTKLTIVTTTVILGFLFQNGFLSYLYYFFIKENYIKRIFIDNENLDTNGQPIIVPTNTEPATTEGVVQDPAQQAAGNVNANANGNAVPPQPGAAPVVPGPAAAAVVVDGGGGGEVGFNWRHTLFGGGIAVVRRRQQRQRQNQQQRPTTDNDGIGDNNDAADRNVPLELVDVNNNNNNAIIVAIGTIGTMTIQILYDIFILFGSFFLSIFPMWKPTPVQDTDDNGNDNDEEEADDNDNNNNNEQQQEEEEE